MLLLSEQLRVWFMELPLKQFTLNPFEKDFPEVFLRINDESMAIEDPIDYLYMDVDDETQRDPVHFWPLYTSITKVGWRFRLTKTFYRVGSNYIFNSKSKPPLKGPQPSTLLSFKEFTVIGVEGFAVAILQDNIPDLKI